LAVSKTWRENQNQKTLEGKTFACTWAMLRS
jgi:hypothetical protein